MVRVTNFVKVKIFNAYLTKLQLTLRTITSLICVSLKLFKPLPVRCVDILFYPYDRSPGKINVYMNRFISLLLLVFILFPSFSYCQFFSRENNYPQGYFQWPVDAKVALAANFGELRPNHYHMGLDCKTDQKQNVPILAAADGYIAKVKIEPYGFGRAIYINHPNGLTTLYAHLNRFYPELEKYITEQQYKLQQWKVFIDIPANLLPVKKGDFIANSGNTGGSQGPHLHFEIRDTRSDKVLNPLLFGFPIKDNIPPDMIRLAVYDRRYSTYEQVPKIYPLKKVNGVYKPVGGNITVKTDKVSFAITAYDRYTGSTNQNGIYRAELYYNGWAISGFELDSISYDETRYLNAHIDYKTRANGGPYLQHLSRLPGYENGIYKSAPGEDGVIRLPDTSSVDIKIIATDADFNQSEISFTLKREPVLSERVNTAEGQLFRPGQVNVFENEKLQFYLPEKGIYDSFHFTFRETAVKQGSPVYQLHNNMVPVQQYFTVRIKDNFSITDTGRIMMKKFWNSKQDFKKASLENNRYKAAFRDFGNYQLILDTMPPVVVPLSGFRDGINASRLKRIAFAVTDNTEELASFTALLDGKWLRFSNDKGKVFIYDFDEYCSAGEHELKIIVKDLAGNQTEKNYRFTR